MMKQCIFTIVLLSALAVAGQPHGTGQAGRHIVLDLWPGGVPADNGVDYQAPANPNDVKPQLHVFLPSGHSDASRAVIICPGGAYAGLAMQHEGFEWKDFFTSRNIAALVLLYRLPHGHHQVPADDLLQAMRLTRQHAALWHIDPGQIGVMGSSAGGHLALYMAEGAADPAVPIRPKVFKPRGVMLNCPAYDFASFAEMDVFTKSAFTWFIGPRYKDRQWLESVSPRTFIGSFTCPLLVSTCTRDFIRDQALLIKSDCDSLGRAIEFVDIESNDSRIRHVHNVSSYDLPESKTVNDRMVAFMDNILK